MPPPQQIFLPMIYPFCSLPRQLEIVNLRKQIQVKRYPLRPIIQDVKGIGSIFRFVQVFSNGKENVINICLTLLVSLLLGEVSPRCCISRSLCLSAIIITNTNTRREKILSRRIHLKDSEDSEDMYDCFTIFRVKSFQKV